MPITLEQIKKRKAQDPVRYEQDRKALMAFSKLLYSVGASLALGDEDNDLQIGRRLRNYSDAFEMLARDPSNPSNQEAIDDALDLLAGFGDFLGGQKEQYSDLNICSLLWGGPNAENASDVLDGLRAFERFCGFGVDVQNLYDGKIDQSTQEEKEARRELIQDWKAARERERQEVRDRERRAEEARRAAEQQKQEDLRKAKEREEQEEAEQQRLAEEEAKREEEARKERERRAEEAKKSVQQREMERIAAELKERQRQIELQKDFRERIDRLRVQAREPQASDNDKKYRMAEALAYHRELRSVDPTGVQPIDVNRINGNLQSVYSSALFTIAEREGKLDELTGLSLEALDNRVLEMEHTVGRRDTAAQFGQRMNPELRTAPDADAQGVAYTRNRAKQIFKQMDGTWRFLGSSAQYDAANQAMQEIGDKESPTQLDHYLAGETVKAYVAKNLQKAESAVGMTRMACAMAFLKQTMSKEGFEAYCTALNAQRHIKQVPPGSLKFDKTEPRCFVPDEIGTVQEVYNTVRERFFHLYDEETGFKAPDPRDLAMLTALKNLQAKAGVNENLVVEHEALQKEIEKVQADRRFQDALKNHTAHELIEMAGGHNLDTISGYAEDLKPDQRERVQQELDRLSEKEAARLAKEEEERKAKEEAERRAKEEADRLEAERLEKERERLKREAEEREFQKFRETNKNADELLKTLYPTFDKVAEPNAAIRALDNFNIDPLEEYVEFAAKLKAINELGKAAAAEKKADKNDRKKGYINIDALNKRVENLKGDPMIRQIAQELRDGEDVPEEIEKDRQKGVSQKYDGKLYAIVKLSGRVQNMYVAKHEELADEILPSRWPTVGQAYGEFKPNVDALVDGGSVDYKKAGILAAKMAALREIEEKGVRGLDTPVNVKQWKKRAVELYSDKLFDTIGQNLAGPDAPKKLARAFNMSTNREQTFAEYVTRTYREMKLEREQKLNAQKQSAQQNPDAPKPKEPELKGNGNGGGLQAGI